MDLVLQGKNLQLGEYLILLFCGFLSHVTNSTLLCTCIYFCAHFYVYVCILMFLAFKDSLHLKIQGVMGVYSVLSELC